MARIVLAHGILGFGSVVPDQPINYFNGISDLYRSLGHDVLCPSVAPLGSILNRASALETQISGHWRDDAEPIFLLAHSMGGLDCRHMLATTPSIVSRVRRLITIATPHFGSPVADAILHPAFPGHLLPLQWLSSTLSNNAGALEDLETRTALQDPNVADVDYQCIGCDTSSLRPKSPLFTFTAELGQFSSPNDGVVGLQSAWNGRGQLDEVWPVDHGGAIGWPSGGVVWQIARAAASPPPDHLARYRSVLVRLIA